MDLPSMISESTMLAQLLKLEKKYALSEHEKDNVWEKNWHNFSTHLIR